MAVSRTAQADVSKTVVALDLDFASSVKEPKTDLGGGGALRVGRKLDLLLLSLTPELGGAYHAFGGDAGTSVFSGFIGGRLGIGKVVEPSVFAHAGVAHVSGVVDRTAPQLDGGVALDLTLLPLINLGVHGSYNVVLPSDDALAVKFFIAGAHAAFVF